MPMPPASWRTGIQASFRGATFHTEVDSQSGGRRNVTHEFPKRDVPWTEGMGRRARRWTITGYVVCSPLTPDYIPARDALINACEADDAGTLVFPTLGTVLVKCDTYAMSETRERGGMATFEMAFVEAGNIYGAVTAVTVNTQAAATAAATNLGNVSATSLNNATQSSLSGGGGITAI